MSGKVFISTDQLIFGPNKQKLKIFILGSGNISFHLTKAFVKNKITISGLYSRNEIEGKKIAKIAKTTFYPQIEKVPVSADVYLICVSDDAIIKVSDRLPKSIRKSKIVAHTSGSKSIKEALSNCKNGGVFYPLQTFTKGKRMSYRKIPICVNGKNITITKQLTQLGQQISKSVQTISDQERKKIHLSAVIINNFVNHLIFAAEDLLEQENINKAILQPLLEETLKKQKSLGAFAAQTGPARRADNKTMNTHLELLKKDKPLKEIYECISKSIQKKYEKK